MTRQPSRFPFTTAAVVVSCIVLAAGFFGLELPAGCIGRIEQNEFDDITVARLARAVQGADVVQTGYKGNRVDRTHR